MAAAAAVVVFADAVFVDVKIVEVLDVVVTGET